MNADILRKKFLDFFRAKKHKIVDSDSLVPKDDPTVLFTPAGMNQFKSQFLGHLAGFTRAVATGALVTKLPEPLRPWKKPSEVS